MLEQKNKVIDGVPYMVTQMTGFKALNIQTKLIKLLGPAVSSVLTGGSLDVDTLKETMFSKLPEILSQFDDKIVNEVVTSLFESGVFKKDNHGNPESIDFDIEFAGNMNRMWKVTLFILEVNFFSGKSIMSSLPTIEEIQNKMKED